MTIKEGFCKREICGEYIITAEGLAGMNFNKIIALNSTAAYLWDNIQGKDFSVEDLRDLLLAQYDVDSEKALSDSIAIAEQWKEAGLVI